MARRTGTVKLSIVSTFDERGTKRAERAIADFQRKFEVAEGSQAVTLARASMAWDQKAAAAERAGARIQAVGRSMSDVGASMTRGLTLPIVAVGAAMTKTAIDFESAFAGVRKTVDATEEQFAELRTGIRNMALELPATREEIAGVAEAAGQLGIETDNILGFTRVMIDLGESTDLSANDAATALAQLANITGMSQDEFSNLGSSVVALGNNMATTESKIVEMTMRIAGAGSQVGMSEDQMLALAAALSSVGIEAEAGGSAISKTMIEIAANVATGGSKLAKFAKASGMSSAEFTQAWEEDATGALMAFITGLGDMEEQGGSTLAMLEELGITEVRQRDALLRAAGASDLFAQALNVSSGAWRENTALAKEAAQRYATTGSQLAIAKNHVTDIALEFGDALAPALIDAIDAAKPVLEWAKAQAQAFSALDEDQQRQILAWVGIAAAIGPVLSVTGNLVTTVGGAVKAYGALSSALGTYTAKQAAASAAGQTSVGVIASINSATGLAKLGYVGLAAAVGVATGNLINQIPAIKANGEELGKLAGKVSTLKQYMDESNKSKPWWAYTGAIGAGIYGAQQAGGAAGLASAKVPLFGSGAYVTSPTLAVVGDKPEYIINPKAPNATHLLGGLLHDMAIAGNASTVTSSTSTRSITIAPGAVQISVSGSSASPSAIAAEVDAALRRIVRSSQLMGA